MPAPYIDTHLEIDSEDQLRTKFYHKRDSQLSHSELVAKVPGRSTHGVYICKTQIDVQSSNRRPLLKYMAVFHFLKLTSNSSLTYTSNDVTPVRTWF